MSGGVRLMLNRVNQRNRLSHDPANLVARRESMLRNLAADEAESPRDPNLHGVPRGGKRANSASRGATHAGARGHSMASPGSFHRTPRANSGRSHSQTSYNP